MQSTYRFLKKNDHDQRHTTKFNDELNSLCNNLILEMCNKYCTKKIENLLQTNSINSKLMLHWKFSPKFVFHIFNPAKLIPIFDHQTFSFNVTFVEVRDVID